MRTGLLGAGKLGLCLALVLDSAGHQVTAYDPDPRAGHILAGECEPPREEGIDGLLENHSITMVPSPADVVAASDVVFVAVPTPHSPAYGGETPVPAQRRDFDYAALVTACRAACTAANGIGKDITLVVVSTVLPGTCDRLIRPLLGAHVTLVYSPAFIAMGAAIADFRQPEFTLIGCDRAQDARALRRVLSAVHSRPAATMSIASAELTKVSYNTFISMKIVFGSALMEICHKTGADCDDVAGALAMATDRVISPRYLRGGMPDGGSCHPRDLVAMSWLAERLDLSYDLLGEMAKARDAQAGWIADLAVQHSDLHGLPVMVLGKAYKAGSALTNGSPALLLHTLLSERNCPAQIWDPVPDQSTLVLRPAVYVVAVNPADFAGLAFPDGSVVLDPWGYIPDADGVTVIRIGRKQ